MIGLTVSDVDAAGGILAALSDKSIGYVHELLHDHRKSLPTRVANLLDRTIVHVDPHLDEYLADLVFRACLPKAKWRCELIEQAIFSEDDDLGARLLWPNAAVLGLGSTLGGGAQPLFLFDEHIEGQAKVAASCSQIVADKMLDAVPWQLAGVLNEANVIDEFAGAHPQHLSNVIKTLHEVQFSFDQPDDSGARTLVTPSAGWKQAIVDACLVAVLFCVQNGIDLVEDPDVKRAALNKSLENYLRRSSHGSEPRFAEAANRMRSVFADQRKVFAQAILRDSDGPMTSPDGASLPQLLVLARVLFACEHCWGPDVRDFIATHFWEGELQSQLSFYSVEEAIDLAVRSRRIKVSTKVGAMTHHVMREIEVSVPDRQSGRPRTRRANVWVTTMTAPAGVMRVHQALQHYLTESNFGCGVILIRNATIGTSALFRGANLPEELWRKLVQSITSKEPECWHVIERADGNIAPFILNGNKTHQYVPRSSLDSTALAELVNRSFFR